MRIEKDRYIWKFLKKEGTFNWNNSLLCYFCYVICRHRVQKTRKQIRRQMNRNIMHFAMMQMFAIDSVRIDRVFSFGIPQETLIVPDLLNKNERRHINELLRVK
ncbi:hypothetical protein HZU73_02446 [Apis mellifera caucasica]|nr:hypothetical protein HZU73_02446 [Apis mellifera caucasica]